MIDLHCHSVYSDGLDTPEILLSHALEAQLTCLALTDHDTVAGVQRLQDAAKSHSIQIITGVELSTRWKKYDIHIIGLNIDCAHPVLHALLEKHKTQRVLRAQAIGERLHGHGIENAYQKACVVAGHEHIGRPHFAQVLIQEGKVPDFKAAFLRFLGQGRLAYVPTQWSALDEAVRVIVEAGGQAVIAHPLKYGLTRTKLFELIQAFKAAGGVGFEVVSGEMTPVQILEAAGLCARFQLLASSGSDYHGQTLSRRGLGRQAQLPVNCPSLWETWTC